MIPSGKISWNKKLKVVTKSKLLVEARVFICIAISEKLSENRKSGKEKKACSFMLKNNLKPYHLHSAIAYKIERHVLLSPGTFRALSPIVAGTCCYRSSTKAFKLKIWDLVLHLKHKFMINEQFSPNYFI